MDNRRRRDNANGRYDDDAAIVEYIKRINQ